MAPRPGRPWKAPVAWKTISVTMVANVGANTPWRWRHRTNSFCYTNHSDIFSLVFLTVSNQLESATRGQIRSYLWLARSMQVAIDCFKFRTDNEMFQQSRSWAFMFTFGKPSCFNLQSSLPWQEVWACCSTDTWKDSTLCLKKRAQLWNGIARNCNDRFWWYLAEIFKSL